MWKAEDAVWLPHTQFVGSEAVEWDEMGIILEVDEADEFAVVVNEDGKEFNIPLDELEAYDS